MNIPLGRRRNPVCRTHGSLAVNKDHELKEEEIVGGGSRFFWLYHPLYETYLFVITTLGAERCGSEDENQALWRLSIGTPEKKYIVKNSSEYLMSSQIMISRAWMARIGPVYQIT